MKDEYDKARIEAALGLKLDDAQLEQGAKVDSVNECLEKKAAEARGTTLFGVDVTLLSREALLGGIAVIGQQIRGTAKFQYPHFDVDALRRVFKWEEEIEAARKAYVMNPTVKTEGL